MRLFVFVLVMRVSISLVTADKIYRPVGQCLFFYFILSIVVLEFQSLFVLLLTLFAVSGY